MRVEICRGFVLSLDLVVFCFVVFFNVGASELWKYAGGCGNSISRFRKVLDKNKQILKEIG